MAAGATVWKKSDSGLRDYVVLTRVSSFLRAVWREKMGNKKWVKLQALTDKNYFKGIFLIFYSGDIC